MGSPMDWQSFEAYVFEKMSKTKLPGLSIAVVKEGEVIYTRGFGFRNLESAAPMTPQTRVGIGSVTKSFTALAVMMLSEEGKLRLQDPIEAFLPLRLQPFGQPVQIWHLLTHSSGIPATAYAEALIYHTVGEEATWVPMGSFGDLKAFLEGAEPWAVAGPGQRFFYLNEGYRLLGHIIEAVSGKTYEEFIEERILKPLGMKRTTLRQRDVASDPDWATPYLLDGNGKHLPSRFPFGVFADGGLISTTLDLCRYLQLYLHRGESNGDRLVSSQSLEQMETPHISRPSSLLADEGYGFGWSIHPDFLGHKLVSHEGSVLVHTAFLSYIPDLEVGVAVLANASGHPLVQIGMVALAGVLGKNPEALPFVQNQKLFNQIAGRYETFKGTMQLRASFQGDVLFLESHGRLLKGSVPFLPEELTDRYARFSTAQRGRKVRAEFFIEGEDVTLIYEPYKLVRTGA